jgi:predicted Zn-dependent protease
MLLAGGVALLVGARATPAEPTDLLGIMTEELDRSVRNLAAASESPMYYLQYAVTDTRATNLSVGDGGRNAPQTEHRRFLDADLRVGDPQLDSTHEIRGGNWRDNYSDRRLVDFPLTEDPGAIRAALWHETEYQYRKAQERYTKVITNRQIKVEEEDQSADFAPGTPQQFVAPPLSADIDTTHWNGVLKRVGGYLAELPFVRSSGASLSAEVRTTYLVNNEGTRVQQSNAYVRLTLRASGMASDGMDLDRYESFDVADPAELPDEPTVRRAAETMAGELQALIDAPIVEPYIGPAILRNRASGVFFHEIFGHRIEGHRQKSESEGQTFTKKVGQPILPDFISVYDDPTLARFDGRALRGYYKLDDEGTLAQRVVVVDRGILRNFLTTRSPIENFPASNGHARRQYGFDTVARQGNLVVQSEKVVPYDELRRMLIAECRKQGKPYGLVFDDISGGFTMTGRGGPQAFKVLPLLVYRVYADGRPDEVVRGVDIVGTPLTSFSKILMAGDDPAIFNGTCGAESGGVPVSAISPSLLVSEIVVEKRQKSQEKPPILPSPGIEER